MSDQGVMYIAYGRAARQEARLSCESLARIHPLWPVQVVTGPEPIGWAPSVEFADTGTPGRWAKVNLDNLTPFSMTLFLDADTRVYDKLDIGFNLLRQGWDMVMVPSKPQRDRVAWHLAEQERNVTLWECSIEPLQLNTGVIWFQKTRRVTMFFREWRRQWERFKDKDQGAFLRALELRKPRIAVLGRPYNGGAVVGHRFGMARG